MSLKARTVLVAAGLALGLVMVSPAQSRACEFLRRLFCWCHRSEPVTVAPIVEPRFYLSDDCRTEAYYPPSYGCSTQVELGTEPPPAPPAQDGYLESPPEKTFQDETEQSSEKPAEKGDTQGEQPPAPGTEAAPDKAGDEPPKSPEAAADGKAAGSTRIVWQPIRRATARKLLSRQAPSSRLSRSDRARERYTDPGWVPVKKAHAKGLAAK